jgi:hypothetical protein
VVQEPVSSLSDYEQDAWRALVEQAQTNNGPPPRYAQWAEQAKQRAKGVGVRARTAVKRVPGVDQTLNGAQAAMTTAMEGLHTAFIERGLNSVTSAGVFASFDAEGIEVRSYEDIRRLDLKVCDRSVPRRKEKYVALGVSEGVVASLAVSGTTVSSTVSGGTTLGVAAGAVIADVTAVLVGMGRIVALVAAHYGYDVREPDEQVFTSGVLAYSSASNSAEKAASLASLSRLTQQMMRRTTWKQLQTNQLVDVIQRVVTSLGFKLTHRKLAQAVPIAGALVNGGLNARIVHRTFDRAQRAYRLRFLTEKYGLDPADWAPTIVDADVAEVPLVDEFVEAELESAGDPDQGRMKPSD